MPVSIRYFAAVRETVGKSADSLTLDALQTPTVAGLFDWLCEAAPELAPMRPHLRAAINREFVDFDHPLQDGDEVAFIPPVSGGSGASERIALTRDRLEPQRVAELVRHPGAGAVVTFEGVVRNETDGHPVEWLEYDAYPEMVVAKLQEIVDDAEARWPEARVAVHHRWGKLEIGEAAVVTAVSCPHRAAAYEASAWLIDRLKEAVPIWKKEVGPDGSQWVGMGP